MQYYVYILASENNNAVYVGVTNNLIRRVYEHKNDFVKGFTQKYKIHKLVYYEETTDVTNAIVREKQLKSWCRDKKEKLINKFNPQWKDLYNEIICP